MYCVSVVVLYPALIKFMAEGFYVIAIASILIRS